MAWSNSKWAKKLERKRQESDFLRDNDVGAQVGGAVGGAAGGVAAVAGIYAIAATAPVLAAAEGTEAVVAAGGTAAVAATAGRKLLKPVVMATLLTTVGSAADLGQHGGAYAGAGIQASIRWLREKAKDL